MNLSSIILLYSTTRNITHTDIYFNIDNVSALQRNLLLEHINTLNHTIHLLNNHESESFILALPQATYITEPRTDIFGQRFFFYQKPNNPNELVIFINKNLSDLPN
jgi:hypothetical protein